MRAGPSTRERSTSSNQTPTGGTAALGDSPPVPEGFSYTSDTNRRLADRRSSFRQWSHGLSRSLPYGRQTITDDDVQAVADVLTSDFLTTGPQVEAFEADVGDCDRHHARGSSDSCTSALHAAYEAMGVGPGDEIVTSPMTFAATGNAALYLGARPVLRRRRPLDRPDRPDPRRGRDHQPHPSHRRHRLRGSASRLRRAPRDRRSARHPDHRGCRTFARSHRPGAIRSAPSPTPRPSPSIL